mgnify:FL=1
MTIVTTEWLENNLEKVKILDCSWHLPNKNRNPKIEFEKEHIKNAIYFDLDESSNKKTNLPHMMPDLKSWEKIVSEMGIYNKDEIVIYDNSELLSSCRCWFMFIYFGHDPKLVHVLDGGLKKWKLEKRNLTNQLINHKISKYKAHENFEMIKNKNQINENINKKKFFLVDARSKARFQGKEREPRDDVRSGSIPNSFCLPFTDIINENHTFKKPREILNKFNDILGSKNEKKVVFSCGSGVTATVLALAYYLINTKYKPSIYDGSWAEYGKI